MIFFKRRELLSKIVERRNILAKYFAEYFMSAFEKKVVYYHFDKEYLKARFQEEAKRVNSIMCAIFRDV